MSTVQSETNLLKQLNLQVANWTLLYTKLHNYHWFVKGPNFFTLHAKFEELYDAAATYIDDIAERMLAIGGSPVATLKEALELSPLSEASGETAPEQMVASVIADFETVGKQLKEGMKAAEEAGDQATSDLLLGIVESLEKHNWMLNAYLGK